MDTSNIILHWIAHFRVQVNKTEAKCWRPRPTCRDLNITATNNR